MTEPEARRREVEIALLAQRLYVGYLEHHAAITVATDPRAVKLAPAREPGQSVSVGRIQRRSGEVQIKYHFTDYLGAAREPEIQEEYGRVWLSGALLTLGDALQRAGLDPWPEAQLVRHLRNAVAHGNRFDIRYPEELERYPAYMRRGLPERLRTHEITLDLHGTPLWEFIEAVDVLTLFNSVNLYVQNPSYR